VLGVTSTTPLLIVDHGTVENVAVNMTIETGRWTNAYLNWSSNLGNWDYLGIGRGSGILVSNTLGVIEMTTYRCECCGMVYLFLSLARYCEEKHEN